MPDPIRLASKLALFSDHWAPRVIAQMNDYQLKVVKIRGEFVWHAHEDTDETFLVLAGHMRIDLRDGSVELGPGELYVVPRGVEHKPCADAECHVLLIEPAGVVNTGEANSDLTADNDVWI